MAQSLDRVRKKKELPPIQFKPFNPARGKMTYEEAVLDSKRHREASKKAEDAYKQAMAEAEPDKPIEEIKKDNKLAEKKQELISLTTRLNEHQAELAECTPADETRPIKMKIGRLKKQIESVEAEIAALEL